MGKFYYFFVWYVSNKRQRYGENDRHKGTAKVRANNAVFSRSKGTYKREKKGTPNFDGGRGAREERKWMVHPLNFFFSFF